MRLELLVPGLSGRKGGLVVPWRAVHALLRVTVSIHSGGSKKCVSV